MNVCDVRVGVLIPDRGDRPKFLAQCLAMMNRQTLRPVHIELVNDTAMSNAVDITWRYRLGYERIGASVDVIAFIENDDWYHPQYLATASRDLVTPVVALSGTLNLPTLQNLMP